MVRDDNKFDHVVVVEDSLLLFGSAEVQLERFVFRYTRNLVDEGNGKFNLIILCWGEGHGSAIHDHANSHCVMKVLQGEICEVIICDFHIKIILFHAIFKLKWSTSISNGIFYSFLWRCMILLSWNTI